MLNEAERGLLGFRQAIDRFNTADGANDQDAALIALTEAITWVAALDEWFRRQDVIYQPRRDAALSGQLVRAMCWARNRGLHQLAELHEVSPGRRYPKRFPLRYRELVWRDRSKLPAGNPDAKGERYYDQHLAGQMVRVTLPTALAFLDQVGR